MADTQVAAHTENGSRATLPTELKIDATQTPKHTPREMDRIEAMAGKPISDFTPGMAERMAVWLHLRRLGYDPTWEEAADVLVEFVTPDPQTAGPASEPPASSISRGSATTGA